MATTWLLVMTTAAAMQSVTTFADGGYASEALCKRTGVRSAERLNQKEREIEAANTTRPAPHLTVASYKARQWSFDCMPTDKE